MRFDLSSATISSIQYFCWFSFSILCYSMPYWILLSEHSRLYMCEPMCIYANSFVLLFRKSILYCFMSIGSICWPKQTSLCINLSSISIIFWFWYQQYLPFRLSWWLFCWWINKNVRLSLSCDYSAVWRYIY